MESQSITQLKAAPKETKAQRIERLKRAKNPWEALDEIREFERKGRASVLPEWTSVYFRWWGIYTQGDGAGAVGGQGGEGKATDYFMFAFAFPTESCAPINCEPSPPFPNATRAEPPI